MSLNLRIILSATLVLIIFITLTAAALNRAFYESTESALRDRLTSQLYALMAAAEIEQQKVIMPSDELDALLGVPSSGVYAYITRHDASPMWQSSSVLGSEPPAPVALGSGQKSFQRKQVNGSEYYLFAYGVNWSTEATELALTFNIMTDLKSFNRQIQQYRQTLWGWLLTMAILLLLSQALILRWGLLPLRKVGQELSQIENGNQQQIEDDYPREISRLTENINQLLEQEREQKTRYRNALGDLAHSLKTPLAVLQGGLQNPADPTLQEQITRMNAIVEYQLQRAATAGSTAIGKTVNI
ncbi:MAG: HAMP domain-containing protein, partial [Gammaproteobacteria bacterium]|nr:HAMP domain-containing protein [Gammaproteobacteria bacterium]